MVAISGENAADPVTISEIERSQRVEGGIVFVIVVAFLVVLIVGSVCFTNVVEEALPTLKAAVVQTLRPQRPRR